MDFIPLRLCLIFKETQGEIIRDIGSFPGELSWYGEVYLKQCVGYICRNQKPALHLLDDACRVIVEVRREINFLPVDGETVRRTHDIPVKTEIKKISAFLSFRLICHFLKDIHSRVVGIRLPVDIACEIHMLKGYEHLASLPETDERVAELNFFPFISADPDELIS